MPLRTKNGNKPKRLLDRKSPIQVMRTRDLKADRGELSGTRPIGSRSRLFWSSLSKIVTGQSWAQPRSARVFGVCLQKACNPASSGADMNITQARRCRLSLGLSRYLSAQRHSGKPSRRTLMPPDPSPGQAGSLLVLVAGKGTPRKVLPGPSPCATGSPGSKPSATPVPC